MTRQYTSFLIRCWRLDEDEQRIKIEHIQSGENVQVETLMAAIDWLDEFWRQSSRAMLAPERDAARD